MREGEGNGLRLSPPLTPHEGLRSELVAAGFSAFDAATRLKKHPPERLRDALDELAYRHAQKPIAKQAGFVAAYLDKGWAVSPAVEAARKQSRQEAKTLLSVTNPARPSEPNAQGQFAPPVRPEPCQCPLPKELLEAARRQVGLSLPGSVRREERRAESAPYDAPSAEEMRRREALRRQADEIEARRAAG